MTLLKPISIWAVAHKWPSRLLIILSFIMLSFLGVITGLLFDSLNISLSSLVLLASLIVCVGTWIIYPFKKERLNSIDKQKLYALHKSCDLVLISVTFIMFVYFGNHQTTPFNSTVLQASAVNTSSTPGDSSKTYHSIAEFKKMMKDENGKSLKWKERKKLMKTQIKAIKNSNLSEGGKIALIILTVLVAIGLAILVAGLACSLSCSGSEAAAVLIAIIGYGAIVFLTILVIRSIVKKERRDRAKAESSTSQ